MPTEIDLFQTVEPLKCWTCESHTEYGSFNFCQERFDLDLAEFLGSITRSTCKTPSNESAKQLGRPVCMKMKFFRAEVNQTIVQRKCHWVRNLSDENSCSDSVNKPEVELCEACSTDLCNGTSNAELLMRLLLLGLLCMILKRWRNVSIATQIIHVSPAQ